MIYKIKLSATKYLVKLKFSLLMSHLMASYGLLGFQIFCLRFFYVSIFKDQVDWRCLVTNKELKRVVDNEVAKMCSLIRGRYIKGSKEIKTNKFLTIINDMFE